MSEVLSILYLVLFYFVYLFFILYYCIVPLLYVLVRTYLLYIIFNFTFSNKFFWFKGRKTHCLFETTVNGISIWTSNLFINVCLFTEIHACLLVHTPANPGRFIYSVTNLLTLAGLWTLFGL